MISSRFGCKPFWFGLVFLSVVLFMFALSGVTPVVAAETGADERAVRLDRDLLSLCDYLELVYEDDRFKQVNYLRKEDVGEAVRKSWCIPSPKAPSGTTTGIWLWEFTKIPGKETQILDQLKGEGIRRVYLQIGPDLDLLKPFLILARERGVAVFALDGAPDYINDHRPLIEHIRRLRAFNAKGERLFTGFQIDVEPYTKPDFNLRKGHYAERYLTMV
ncbi:MAG TPA: hypothetical protein VN260_01795, partial [Dissulfurispiraceae bacterium]|nr:hypothetical protein [Dissulfurispiraceae bacterium]